MSIFFKRKQTERSKSLVIGLDGVPYSLLRNLEVSGHIRNMSEIFKTGYFGQMNVTIPEISSVSWSSFMTGTQPGEHGIFGFIDLYPNSYKILFPNFRHLRAPTIWNDLSQDGIKTVVVNMPATYPALEINGVLIAGFVAIDFDKSVYPPAFILPLKKIGYQLDVDTKRARKDHDFLMQDLFKTLDARERAVNLLWEEVDWDLFIVVITGTDRLMHFLWDAYEDNGHEHHHDFLDYFNKVDGFVGRVYERFMNMSGTNRFYMLSDHGFAKIKSEVYLNQWLQENGYLQFKKQQPETIMDIGPGSIAFALDPSRIFINVKDKYPLGIVDIKDYERTRQDLKAKLEKLSSENGDPIVKRVFKKEEIYSGPCLSNAADLLVLSNNGYDLKGKVNHNGIFGRTDLSGMHTYDDAFFFSSSGEECTSIFHIKKIISEPFLQNR